MTLLEAAAKLHEANNAIGSAPLRKVPNVKGHYIKAELVFALQEAAADYIRALSKYTVAPEAKSE